MKRISIICLLITCLIFSHPALSMNSRDNDEQTNTYSDPISIIIIGTPTLHRGNNIAPISAYYQSGCIVLGFYEMYECALVTILNTSTNDSVEYVINKIEGTVCLNISEIVSNGMIEILISNELGEVYCGSFIL